jgi:segregation and condensation protein B
VTRKKSEPLDTVPPADARAWDDQPTVNLTGELPEGPPARDDVESEAIAAAEDAAAGVEEARELSRSHLRGLLEALVFASDKPVKSGELARLASAPVKQVRELLAELKETYAARGVVLDEVAGGWLFRTSVQYAPFVREMSSEKPVRLSRAQVETLAIAAYRQPITRPEVDDIRGVDSGATLKLLLERDLVRILGKKDEPGRPILYGTTNAFLEFFGLKSLKDLPTLKEFTELSDESRLVAEAELGDVLPPPAAPADDPGAPSDTLTPPPEHDTIAPPAPPTHDDVGDADDEAP